MCLYVSWILFLSLLFSFFLVHTLCLFVYFISKSLTHCKSCVPDIGQAEQDGGGLQAGQICLREAQGKC